MSERRETGRCSWPIVNESGVLLATHHRIEYIYAEGTRKKRMWWEPAGVRTAELPLYGLQGLLAASPESPVVIVEGEKACDALTTAGFLSVGTVTGAHTIPSDESLRPLAERTTVLVWPDNDADGRGHMERVAARLLALGAAEIRWVDWREAPEKGDAADYLDAHPGDQSGLRGLLEAARPYKPKSVEDDQDSRRRSPLNDDHLRDQLIPFAHLVRLSDVQPTPITWLWRGYIPRGKITLLDGDPGQSKSTMALDLAARVTTGRTMPDGSPGISGGVVILTYEDGLADTVRPRLDAADGDTSRVVALQGVGAGDDERLPSIPQDLQAIRQAITEVSAVLVIIDPLMAALGAGVDSHRDQDVRRVLSALSRLADETAVAMLVVRHLNKAQGGKALYRGGGSIGIAGAARAVLLAANDPDSEGDHVLAVVKINVAAQPPSRRYRSITAANGAASIEWLGVSDLSADALLAMPIGSEAKSALDEAVAFLSKALADGPTGVADVTKAAKALGISEPTLNRAKAKLGVRAYKGGMDTGWYWSLPEGDQDPRRRSSSGGDPLPQAAITFGTPDHGIGETVDL